MAGIFVTFVTGYRPVIRLLHRAATRGRIFSVPNWSTDSIAAISPQHPELSATGKTVIITGAICFPYPFPIIDITRKKSLAEAASTIGTWDILTLSAGFISAPSPATSTDTQEWHTKAFLPTANNAHVTILAVTTWLAAALTTMLPGLSAYMTSKLAQTKRIEFVSPENPSVFAATVHPSMVVTDMFNKSGGKEEALAMDKIWLLAHLSLKASAQVIQSGVQMTTYLFNDWPYSSV
ncbi:short chain dehydrogenase [Hypoxylon rubiginosum]|uniref:Short chain dehydrogenase n=1 Tax=Hypoxylon rubiginosum TaxID=110542 RepID=A0ACB9Z1D1_9PEZI|nr:short chain dehydrogenase [Hypoxylon rubiginosum]